MMFYRLLSLSGHTKWCVFKLFKKQNIFLGNLLLDAKKSFMVEDIDKGFIVHDQSPFIILSDVIMKKRKLSLFLIFIIVVTFVMIVAISRIGYYNGNCYVFILETHTHTHTHTNTHTHTHIYIRVLGIGLLSWL